MEQLGLHRSFQDTHTHTKTQSTNIFFQLKMNLPVDLGDFHQHDTCHTERTREGQRKMWSLTSEERQAISNLIVWSCLLFLSVSLFSKDIVQHSDNSVQ